MKIDLKIEELKKIAKEHKVSSLYVFGSLVSDKFDLDKSDIDFLVEFKPEYFDGYSENYEDFKSRLEKLYNRRVDVLSYKAIKNIYLLNTINKSKQLIYA